MSSDSDESVEFFYEDDSDDMMDSDMSGSEDDPELDKRNVYDMAMSDISDDPVAALEAFEQLLEMEDSPGSWSLKAQKEIIKLNHAFGKADRLLPDLERLIHFVKVGDIDAKDGEAAISETTEFVISSCSDAKAVTAVVDAALEHLGEEGNDRAAFKIQLRLAEYLRDRAEYGKLQKLCRSLHRACQTPDGHDDPHRSTDLLKVYAVQIQMYTEMKDSKMLNELYERALSITASGIAHPRIMGVIRECGGKSLMMRRKFEEAQADFHEAFKCYDDASDMRKISCLKYLILTNMLSNSSFDPFGSQETLAHKSDSEIEDMTNLVAAYQDRNIIEFEKILKRNKRSFEDDAFMALYIEDLLRNIRTEVLQEIIRPYTRIRISHLASAIRVDEDAVIDLLVSLILDRKINAHIDQVNNLVVLATPAQANYVKYDAVDRWSRTISQINTTLFNKL